MADLEKWPTETEAAAQLGVSVKSIARYAAKGKIEIRKRQRAGKRPENICNPRDVEKLLPAPHVMRDGDPEPQQPGVAVRSKPSEPTWPAALEVVATVLAGHQQAVKVNSKLWLSLDEAAEYSGLRASFIRDSVVDPQNYEEGENVIGIRGGPRGAWRIQRASLEALAG